MSEENKVFVIRRIKKVKKHGHHGGSWKIAYADFVTAMMTFFLLMWLLTLMNKYQLDGIAEYFKKPLKEAFTHQSDKQNKDKDREKNKEKEKEKEKNKEKEKEKEKEKPNKIDELEHKVAQSQAKIDQIAQQMNSSASTEVLGMQTNSAALKVDKEQFMMQMANSQKIFDLKKTPDVSSTMPEETQSAEEGEISSGPLKELNDMKKQIEKNLENDPLMRQFKNQLNFEVTADGLRIELRDLENKPMFSLGKTDFQNYAKSIITWLTGQLNAFPDKRVEIIGHTDTLKYQRDDYSNWELSADRANATRRELVRAGMDKERILRIVGVGDTDLYDKQNGQDPSNRRIEILILTDDAMKKVDRQDR